MSERANLPVVIVPALPTGKRRRIRRLLRRRDGDNCCWCARPMVFGKKGHTFLTATIEHMAPRRFGGSHDPAFLRLAHYQCNIWRDQGRFPVRRDLALVEGEAR